MNSLRCESLTKSFGGIQALQDISIEFPSSGIVAIIGPNGAGKTTLINVLTGFLRPQAGRVLFDECLLSGLPAYKIARLGIGRTFQDLRLISQVSAVENVLLARPHQKGERLLPALFRGGVASEEACNRREAVRWLKFVGLEAQVKALPGELSYGQQKLLTLACCLATDGKILILDEPFAGVHPKMVESIITLLRQLRNLGKLVIFVEHDIASVRQVADLILVMDEGRIIAQGDPAEVLHRQEIIDAYVT